MPDIDLSNTAPKTPARSTEVLAPLGDSSEQVAHGNGQLDDVAVMATPVRRAVERVLERGGNALHGAQQHARDGYDSARELALDAAHEAGEMAERASTSAARYTRHASASVGSFVATHALPLVALSASAGWLAWSVRRSARRAQVRDVYGDALQLANGPREDYEGLVSRSSARRSLRASRSAPTTSGAKLMGVRTRDLP